MEKHDEWNRALIVAPGSLGVSMHLLMHVDPPAIDQGPGPG